MMDPKFSEDQLSQLTEEEREGLIDEEDGDDGADEQEGDDEADAGGDVNKDDEGEGTDAGAGAAGSDAPQAEQNAATPTADEGGTADAAGAGSEEAVAPVEHRPRWLEANDIDEKMAAIDKQREELDAKFDDGELMATELRQQLRTLDEQYRALDRQKTILEVQKDGDLRTWSRDVDVFIAKNSQYADPALQQMLDAEVRRLQTSATNPLSPNILQQAHKAISDRIAKAFNVKADPKPDPAKNKAAGTRRPEPPPTLRNVPAADQVDIDDSGEFAELDRISTRDSVAYEAALSSLKKSNPAAYDRYMAQ